MWHQRARRELKLVAESGLKFFKSFKYDADPESPIKYWSVGAKAVLDLIRNVAVVGAIKFFAKKADSLPLEIVAEIGQLAVAITIGSYANRIHFVGWAEIEHDKLRACLTFLYSVLPGVFVYFCLAKMLNSVIGEIVRSQMMHSP